MNRRDAELWIQNLWKPGTTSSSVRRSLFYFLKYFLKTRKKQKHKLLSVCRCPGSACSAPVCTEAVLFCRGVSTGSWLNVPQSNGCSLQITTVSLFTYRQQGRVSRPSCATLSLTAHHSTSLPQQNQAHSLKEHVLSSASTAQQICSMLVPIPQTVTPVKEHHTQEAPQAEYSHPAPC